MPDLDFYIAREGFRETIMVRDGEDEFGDPAYREATTDEAHAAWVAQLLAERAA